MSTNGSPPRSPRRSKLVRFQSTKDCFGRFDGNDFDVSGLSPVEALAKVSAVAMLTTERVGEPREDASMAQARPRLSEINKRGFLTLDSQMGKKEVMQHGITGEDVLYRQRCYVEGFLPKHLGDEFKRRMHLEDGVMIFMEPPGPEPPGWGPRVPVTGSDHHFDSNTRMHGQIRI